MIGGYTVYNLSDAYDTGTRCGLTLEDAFAYMMDLANCEFWWERVNDEMRLVIRPLSPCVFSMPDYRSTQPDEQAARVEIMRRFFVDGLNDVHIVTDEEIERVN